MDSPKTLGEHPSLVCILWTGCFESSSDLIDRERQPIEIRS